MVGSLTVELTGEDFVILDDMGCGSIVFSQHSEVSGLVERIVFDFDQLRQAWQYASARYGVGQVKNTDPSQLAMV